MHRWQPRNRVELDALASELVALPKARRKAYLQERCGLGTRDTLAELGEYWMKRLPQAKREQDRSQ